MFAGDVGAGKTALAESFGCEMADTLDVPVYLYRLKLTARGSGLVGEMTTLIGDAFALILAEGRKARGDSPPEVRDRCRRRRSRRARPVPCQPSRCTTKTEPASTRSSQEWTAWPARACQSSSSCARNREQAMDPAVTRRAAAIFTFDRPDDDQRRAVLRASAGRDRHRRRDYRQGSSQRRGHRSAVQASRTPT